jgi:hypothetical protein
VLQASCDERRGQYDIIAKHFKVDQDDQNTLGKVAMYHPMVRQLIAQELKLTSEEIDDLCGAMPPDLQVPTSTQQPAATP